MFLGYQKGKIVLTANTREELENAPCMTFDRIEETAVEYALYNGEYLNPEELSNAKKISRKKELLEEADAYDLKSIRPLRAKEAGTATEEDLRRIEEYEVRMENIRKELKELN